MKTFYTLLVFVILIGTKSHAQANLVTYAGNNAKDNFYDVLQISDGTFLVCGYSEAFSWVDAAVPQTTLGVHGIHNALGTNKVGYILQLSSDLQTILQVVKFPRAL